MKGNNVIPINSKKHLGGMDMEAMRANPKTLMDLVREDSHLSAPIDEGQHKGSLANGDMDLSRAFAIYKFAEKNPDKKYDATDKEGM